MGVVEIQQKNHPSPINMVKWTAAMNPADLGLQSLEFVRGKDNITQYRKTYWWCPHHKSDILYDGM